MKAYIGELIGTALLVLIGCGATIFAGRSIGVLGIALAFGFGLDLISAIGLYSVVTPMGIVLTGFLLMSGSSAVSEIIGKIKA